MKNSSQSVDLLFILLIFVLTVLAAVLPGCSSSPGQPELGQSGAQAGSEQAKQETPTVAGQDAESPEQQQASSLSEPKREPREITIGEGTPIIVRTISAISTKTNQPGDPFHGTLEQPLVEEDWVIAKKGAEVEGVVTECDPGGRVQGVARLAVKLKKVTLTDGRTVEIQTSVIRRQAKTTKKKDAQKIGIGAGIGAAIGAITGGGKGAASGAAVGGGAGSGVVMATRGDPATIGSETKLTFKLTDPVRIVEEL